MTSPEDYSALQLAYQRLLALERFKSGFLARTSHELRSPINTIVSLHQLILEDLCDSPEEEKEFIAQSKEAALKMLALFDQIAAVSKLDVGREPPRLEAVDLGFVLPEVEMFTTLQAANQNVRYTVELPAQEIEVYTDARWLKNTLISLIQDAIAYSRTLRLFVEQRDQAVAVVIECDRPAADLQTELDNIPDTVDPPYDKYAGTSADILVGSQLAIDNIHISTGLVLATAHTALPLIKGEFSIRPHPDLEGRSCLQCIFPH